MLADLKIVEDKLYIAEALDLFCHKYSIHEVIKQLNKSTKKETRDRIRYCFSKIAQSNHYKQFLDASLVEEKGTFELNTEARKEFIKYVSSEHSEQFFELLQNHKEDVLYILEHCQAMVPVLLKLISYQYGIKLIKLFKQLYQQDSVKYECLFNPQIRKGLEEGLGLGEGQSIQTIDTVAQMRYLEIVANIAIVGGKCFAFIGQLLNRALNLYKTEDILLKMALVQIVSTLGEGVQTSQLLREHKIWKLVQKDVGDPDQQLYVKKYLLILLIDMANHGFYQFTPKMAKDIQDFLRTNLPSKGQFQQAAIDIVSHLFKSTDGIRIVLQNSQVFNTYVRLSKQTQDSIKQPYYQSLVNLTSGAQNSKEAKESPKYRLVINILNCIGNPSFATGLTQNMHANNYMVHGLQNFSEWFSEKLKMPFEQVEMKLIQIFINLLNYYEVAESLLQVQETTKYLLKPVIPNDHNKQLRMRKWQLVNSIVTKGENDWKDKQLSEYSKNLQKLLKNKNSKESVYALDTE